MTPEQWEKLNQVFGDALELEPSEREAFVRREAGGDPDLLAEVLRLLEASDDGSQLLSSPALLYSRPLSHDDPPQFSVGAVLARRFRIVRFIARGGMGEVYEAEDLELGERVALKAIRRHFDPASELLALFKKEVQLARRVTHPNVCRIFDLQRHEEDEQGPSITLLSMELLKGRTLSEQLKINGPLGFPEALPLIEDIAGGLQAIHDAGIIHGDLKPGNVMLTSRAGESRLRAVVMDFGVALPAAQESDGRRMSRGGTPEYFAPEQEQGSPLTTASDVYTLALIICDLLGVPRNSRMNPGADRMPVSAARALRRCLDPEPSRRYVRPADLAAKLRHSAGSRKRVFMRAGGAVLACGILAGGYVALRPAFESRRSMVISRLIPDSQRIFGGTSISRDGKSVAYVADEGGRRSVWVRKLASGSAVRLVDAFPNRLGGTTFSRDGKFLYYNDGPRIMTIPVAGGAAREVARGDTGSVCVSPDGRSLAFMRREGQRTSLVVADTGGSGAHVVAERNGPASWFFFSCSWSPDSKNIAIGGKRESANGEYPNAVLAVDARTGATKQISEESWGLMGRLNWLHDNSGIVLESSRRGEAVQLYQVPLLHSTATRLTGDMTADYVTLSLGVADDGRTAVGIRHVNESKLWIVPPDGSSAPRQLSADAASQGVGGVSSTPAGGVLFSSNASGIQAIWMAGTDSGAAPRQITPDQVPGSNPQVTPDGRYLVFVGRMAPGDAPVRQLLEGGDLKRLGSGNTVASPTVAPDSQWAFYGRNDPPPGGWALWKSNLDSGEEKLVTKGQIWPLGFTPDGKSLLAWVFLPQGEQFVLLSTATWEITKSLPLPRVALRAAENGAPPRLTPDGRAVSYLDVQGGGSNIWVQPINGGDARQLTHFADQQIFSFAWSRQGDLIVARGTQRSDAVLIRDLR